MREGMLPAGIFQWQMKADRIEGRGRLYSP